MDTREKLAELIEHAPVCESATIDEALLQVSDYLITNGVTVQGTGCVYCEEDSEGYRKTLGAFSITNPFHRGEYFLNTGHCKPRQIYFCPMCGRKLGEC